ncbi:MAG: ABC transporter ATP-binding protein [Acidaminococcaceae bacterium]|nr:ABC transporter ATP-binding protein [Acidaminococcaceae bacterium]
MADKYRNPIVLKTDDITMRFGGVVAVSHLNLEIHQGEIVALIGPNGAGKTTAFNMITGVYTPTEGNVLFNPEGYRGRNMIITGMKPSHIAKLGIARTFQNIRLFKDLSVYENVLIAKHLRLESDVFSAALHLPWYNREQQKAEQEVEKLLKEVGLWELRKEKASSLPYGQQRRLEIVRALATNPTLLLLDEPAAGMNPKETDELTEFIRQIRDKYNLTVFMIEHHMDLVMAIAEKIYVLDFGQEIARGTPVEIQNNQRVIEAYLGVDEDA